jgi:alpha-ketoglutarate-dependent 2,4-dichlorophenoxyacetate dioxygenase
MVRTRPLHPLFGAEIIDWDPAATSGSQIMDTVARCGVLLLRGKHLTDDQFLAFAKSLGPLWSFDLKGVQTLTKDRVHRHSNVDEQGKLLGADNPQVRVGLSAEIWHTDATYAKPMAATSLLMAHTVVPVDGTTEFCDTRVLYEGLDEVTKRLLRGMHAFHSVYEHLAKTPSGLGYPSAASKAEPFIRRPFIRRHKETGRDALCIASHIRGVEGMSPRDGLKFVNDLIEKATTPERVYVHRWRVGDIVMWDTRCTMHRARPYKYAEHSRDMRILRLIDKHDDEAETVRFELESA